MSSRFLPGSCFETSWARTACNIPVGHYFPLRRTGPQLSALSCQLEFTFEFHFLGLPGEFLQRMPLSLPLAAWVHFFIIKAPTRRSQRRLRAKARLSWFLHKTGRVKLNLSRLVSIRYRLSTHHSKDAVLISCISRAIMGELRNPGGASTARRFPKHLRMGAVSAWTHWQECQDYRLCPSSAPRRLELLSRLGQEPAPWARQEGAVPTSEVAPTWEERRGRGGYQGGSQTGKGDGNHHSGQQTGKGKQTTQKGDKGKGKGKPPGGETMVPPEPPWTPTQHMNALPLPPPTTPPPPTAEETTLKELINALKKSSQEMDPEVQAIVQRSHMQEGQKSTKSLYTAVDDLSSARETLDIAKLARHHLHIKWRNFLTDAVQRWRKHTEDFQKEEQELTQQIETAKSSIGGSCQKVRGFQVGNWELQWSDVEAQEAMMEASTDAAEGGSVGTALFRQPGDDENATGNSTSVSRRHGDRGGHYFQQKAEGGRRICGLSTAIWCWSSISCGTSYAAISEPRESRATGVAFCEGRQVVTEVYPCQRPKWHPCILNWTHSACAEAWFVTRWYAIESAYELAWQLGMPLLVSPSTSVKKPHACGKRRSVRFFSRC